MLAAEAKRLATQHRERVAEEKRLAAQAEIAKQEQRRMEWREAAVETDLPKALTAIGQAVNQGRFDVTIRISHATYAETEQRAALVHTELLRSGYNSDYDVETEHVNMGDSAAPHMVEEHIATLMVDWE
jgi:hypothetical protein